MQPAVSSVVNLREHNIFALNLLNVYLLLLEGEMLPGYKTPDFIKRISVRMLMNKLEAGKMGNELLNGDELRTMYAAYHLSNKLLVTSKSAYISGMILQQMPSGHQLKDYNSFHKAMIENNAVQIKDTEERFADTSDDFSEWKRKVEEFAME